MNRLISILFFCLITFNCNAATWCIFSDFNVSITGDYVSVDGSTLSSGGERVYLGDLRTEKGQAIHSLLLTAAISGKSVRYGDNSQTWQCGQFPTYSATTASPQYLDIMTKTTN